MTPGSAPLVSVTLSSALQAMQFTAPAYGNLCKMIVANCTTPGLQLADLSTLASIARDQAATPCDLAHAYVQVLATLFKTLPALKRADSNTAELKLTMYKCFKLLHWLSDNSNRHKVTSTHIGKAVLQLHGVAI
jgi:hypothetical protein